MKKINIGIIGLGTIGSGVVETLRKKHKFIKEHSGLDIVIKRICDKSPIALRKIKIGNSIITRDPYDVLGDKDIDIIIELIGGTREAKNIIIEAIKAKKHVVTANKALLALHGQKIFKLAEKKKVIVRFEASVGGGIPIIKALKEGFISGKIDRIYGIINGTSNFILSKMSEDKYGFDEALKEAQKKGFAEKNPALDINGVDSAHKLSILSLIGFKFPVNFRDIYVEGIKDIDSSDIEYAYKWGYTVKLLAIAKRVGTQLEARVHPTLLPNKHVLSNVGGVYNAIHLKGDLIGESLFYGEGAGRYPTSSAVISDIVDIGNCLNVDTKDYILAPDTGNRITDVKKMDRVKTRYYVRFSAIDKPGVLAKISGILGRYGISISTVTQKERHKEHVVPIVMMTHEAIEGNMRKAIKQIDSLDTIRKRSVAIRVESR